MVWAFYLAATGALLCAALVVFSRNPVGSALWLVGNFIFSAMLFALLAAPFLAVIQLLVYAGAVMVLFLFVLMFLRLRAWPRQESLHPVWVWLVVLLAVVPVISMMIQLLPGDEPLAALADGNFGGVAALSRQLLYGQPLAFELIGLLLLLAVVGGVALSRGGRAGKGEGQ